MLSISRSLIDFAMPFPQRKFREHVLHLLLANDFGSEEECICHLLSQQYHIPPQVLRRCAQQAAAIAARQQELDALLLDALQDYEWKYISAIERSILRLGAYEIACTPHLPLPVTIAEAIRLSRKFATPESARFVHAILDAVAKRQQQRSTVTPEKRATGRTGHF